MVSHKRTLQTMKKKLKELTRQPLYSHVAPGRDQQVPRALCPSIGNEEMGSEVRGVRAKTICGVVKMQSLNKCPAVIVLPRKAFLQNKHP
jgi:hypothetical protein